MGWRSYTLPHTTSTVPPEEGYEFDHGLDVIYINTHHLHTHLRNATSLTMGWRLYTLPHTTSTVPPEEGHEFGHGLEVIYITTHNIYSST